jgi:hypothetical protein
VASAFQQALASSRDRLRVRISIEPSATELHQLHWETLNDPRTPEAPLFMGENVVCSRYLSGQQDWKPIRLRPKTGLKALVAAANPAYLGTGGGYLDEAGSRLAPVDAMSELERVRAALQGIEVSELSAAIGPRTPATLGNLMDRLRDGIDILYLVCHGVLIGKSPILHLDGDGPVEGKDFVQRIRGLDHRPRLVVLASCQSAGQTGASLSALGPMLAEAGVPAVVAMQGKVSMAMIARFMPRFFSELLKDGRIDRAVSVARGEVRDCKQDYWMPALFLRLRDGRIWYEPGFDGDGDEFEQWESISRWVRKKKCVPILGPDVCEHILGTSSELAASLAGENFPFETYQRFDLAKVTQYLAIQNSDSSRATRSAMTSMPGFRKALPESWKDPPRTRLPPATKSPPPWPCRPAIRCGLPPLSMPRCL